MNKKKLACTALAACMALGAAPAQAKESATATAQVYRSTVYVEGQPVVCVNANQKRVPILLYRDSTYIPLRTAGEWTGKNVSWDSGTKTAALSGSVAPKFYNGYDSMDIASDIPKADMVKADVLPDMKITLDGALKSFQNARGEAVYPLIYHDTAYLPLRNIGEVTGMEVKWVSPAQGVDMVYLRTPITDEQKAEVKSYLAQQEALANELMKTATGLHRGTASDSTQIAAVRDTLRKMQELKQPSAKVAAFSAKRYAAQLQDMAVLAQGMTEGNAASGAGKLRNETVEAYSWLVLMSSTLEQTGSSSLGGLQM